jgi:hypothetical protein
VKFVIEQMFITDERGEVISTPTRIFHRLHGEDSRTALLDFIAGDSAELIGDVSVFPGHQATATARRMSLLYTLHAYPGSDQIMIPQV